MLVLDLVSTIAFAGLVLFAGYGIRRVVPILARLNIPAPVIGGFVVASIVMAGGFIGFMLGTTANAMANMSALVERYGPAPKAFLTVPLSAHSSSTSPTS